MPNSQKNLWRSRLAAITAIESSRITTSSALTALLASDILAENVNERFVVLGKYAPIAEQDKKKCFSRGKKNKCSKKFL